MVAIMDTDLIYQKQNPSQQHLKILCREENVWIDAMGTLSTGTEKNWIGAQALKHSIALDSSRDQEFEKKPTPMFEANVSAPQGQ